VKNRVTPPPVNETVKPFPSMSVVPLLTVMAEVNATVQLSPKVIVPCAATAVASSASVGQEVKD
jgi:hypothetical protein